MSTAADDVVLTAEDTRNLETDTAGPPPVTSAIVMHAESSTISTLPYRTTPMRHRPGLGVFRCHALGSRPPLVTGHCGLRAELSTRNPQGYPLPAHGWALKTLGHAQRGNSSSSSKSARRIGGAEPSACTSWAEPTSFRAGRAPPAKRRRCAHTARFDPSVSSSAPQRAAVRRVGRHERTGVAARLRRDRTPCRRLMCRRS